MAAMKIDAEQFDKAIRRVKEEWSIASSTLKEKGAERFGRTFALGIMAIVISYYMIFLPPQKKLSGLQRRIDAAKATADYADQYKGLHDQLNSLYTILPPASAREQRWLTNAVLDSMKAEGIISDSVVPPEEVLDQGFAVQKQSISTSLKFSELVSWLNRLETNKPLMHVDSLSLMKKPDPVGTNSVNCEIGTVIPLSRPGN
jgi:type II secretory pathway component PulM